MTGLCESAVEIRLAFLLTCKYCGVYMCVCVLVCQPVRLCEGEERQREEEKNIISIKRILLETRCGHVLSV